MYVNRVAVHCLPCICRAAERHHACTTREVLILRVHSFSLSLLSLILTSTYPVISRKIKYKYWWLTTVKLHILLAAHLNPTPNDVNGRTCFSQVAEDIRIKNHLPLCLLCIYISHPLFCWSWFPHSVFDLVCNLGTQLSVPLPFPVRSFHLTADKVAQIYRGSSLPYQTN